MTTAALAPPPPPPTPQAYLADPSFHAYVERVEQLWDEAADDIAAAGDRGGAGR